MKKEGEGTFDITMGSYHGAEACELVGLFILNKLTRILGRDNVGLYRDDGLAVLKRKSGPEVDRIRKKLHLTFKNHGLEITLETGLKMTDFLDITLDLSNNRFFPYRKPNNPPSYINKNSNHPPSIIKQIPTMINKRLCDLSCNKEEFEKSKPMYEKALKESGYNCSLKYENQPEENRRRKRRKRRVTWFNPPFCISVKTDVAKQFLALINKHFPKNHKCRPIINRSTVKVSYCCMTNVEI